MKKYLFSTEDYYVNEEDMEDLCYENENNLLKYINEKNYNCLATGKVKRWNGIFSGILYGDFITLYNKVLKDCAIREVYIENNILYIYGIHHDGWVKAEIYFLTDEGDEIYNDNINQENIMQNIIDSKKYFDINDIIKEL